MTSRVFVPSSLLPPAPLEATAPARWVIAALGVTAFVITFITIPTPTPTYASPVALTPVSGASAVLGLPSLERPQPRADHATPAPAPATRPPSGVGPSPVPGLWQVVLMGTVGAAGALLGVAAYLVQRLLAINADIALAATSGMLDLEESSEQPKEVPCPNCNLCDGSGRLLGGLAALPWPFSLWPIKVYRPCPNFKGEYKRAGQTLDELTGTRGSKKPAVRDGRVVPLTRPPLRVSFEEERAGAPPTAPAPVDAEPAEPAATMASPPKARGFGSPPSPSK